MSTSISQYVSDPNVLNIYLFGSRVYGTATPESDYDYIIVAQNFFDSCNVNIHVYTVEQFRLLLERHDIQALECIFAPAMFKIKEHYPYFKIDEIDKAKLRVAISTIASNSWVKAKKKLTVSGDYSVELGIKSAFHSLRILDFGIQIASSGRIQNYGSMNWVMKDLKNLVNNYQHEELWNKIDKKFRTEYNSKSSEFKKLAPKDLTEIDNKVKLKEVLKKHGIDSKELVNDIMFIFKS